MVRQAKPTKHLRLAVPYSRVSTLRQVEEGHSLENQRETISYYCGRRGWEMTDEVFCDAGRSGRSTKHRPGLEAALELVCHVRGVLVVSSLSRLARSTIDACRILAELEAAGADLAITDLEIDTTKAAGKMIFGLMSTLAEFESNQISERVRASNDQIRARLGYLRTGHCPAGWRLEKGFRVPVPEEITWLHHVRWVKQGRTYRAAVERLNAERFPTLKHMRTKIYTPWTYSLLRIACKFPLVPLPEGAASPLRSEHHEAKE